MTRARARRRRGSNRQNGPRESKVWFNPQDAPNAGSELFEWPSEASERALEAIGYWRKVLPRPEFVYFIAATDDPAVKIGRAVDPLKRVRALQCANWRDLAIVEVILGSHAAERDQHLHWQPYLLRGEWYGGGIEPAIMALAASIRDRQIELHKQGHDAVYVQREVPAGMLKGIDG